MPTLTLFVLLVASHASADPFIETSPIHAPLVETFPETRGQRVVVNVWASWCGPCVAELPLLAQLHDRLVDTDATVVTLNIDTQPARARALLRRAGSDLPVLWDPQGEYARLLAPPAMPTSYVLDAEGRVIEIHAGALDRDDVTVLEERLRGHPLLLHDDAGAAIP